MPFNPKPQDGFLPPGFQDARREPVLVLGGGIAGLGAARGLSARGHRIIVIDAETEIGGAHRSRVAGPYTFDVGSIFYEEDALLFRVFPGLRELCPRVIRVERRLSPEGVLREHPLDPREIQGWSLPRRTAALADLAWSRSARKRDGSAEAICLQKLGRHIYEGTGLRDYISRFNHSDPAQIDEEFFFRRMASLDALGQPRRMLPVVWRGLIARGQGVAEGVALRVRPSEGFEALFDPVRRMLEASGVQFELGATIRRIRREGESYVVTTDRGEFRGCCVVSAIPLDTCHRAVFGTDSGLKSLDNLTLFVSAATISATFGNVVYNFHSKGRWKRATLYSRLYPGLGAGREFLSVEMTLPQGTQPDPEIAFADFAAHLAGLDLGVRDLRLEGHDVIRSAYPFHLAGEAGAAAPVLKALEEFGIVAVGRQGRFEYLPTATGVLKRVNHELALAAARIQLRSQESIGA
jgi:protoporphyrinogen oxidase